MKTAIVIPVHNAPTYVARLMGQLIPQNIPTVLVDDASDTDTKEILQLWAARTDDHTALLRNQRQQLFTRTVNRGLRYAKRTWNPEYYCVLNSDVDLKPEWLAKMKEILDQNPTFALVGYRDATPPDLGSPFTLVGEGFVTGHCLLLRGTALDQVGVLCETDMGGTSTRYPEFAPFKGLAHIGSDRLLSELLRLNGWTTVYCDYDGLSHEAGKSWNHDLGWLMHFPLDPLWEPCNDWNGPEEPF